MSGQDCVVKTIKGSSVIGRKQIVQWDLFGQDSSYGRLKDALKPTVSPSNGDTALVRSVCSRLGAPRPNWCSTGL